MVISLRMALIMGRPVHRKARASPRIIKIIPLQSNFCTNQTGVDTTPGRIAMVQK
ncbi:hypothetical protein [Halomonas cerina]|uniref:Uncharacterized protein n=1 Tax=Halomonas cerina TaxID=447424 RepID=A0A839V4C2_9GAMM|nr:hypothetical protein [Halomonas cerina]MBB3188870.1 hypothetical protein [Halomonas cerina]